jgi:hypothetical protein
MELGLWRLMVREIGWLEQTTTQEILALEILQLNCGLKQLHLLVGLVLLVRLQVAEQQLHLGVFFLDTQAQLLLMFISVMGQVILHPRAAGTSPTMRGIMLHFQEAGRLENYF